MFGSFALAVGLTLFCGVAHAQELTLEDALNAVEQDTDLKRAREADFTEIESRARQVTRWSDPSLELEWESSFEHDAELSVVLGQPLEIDGRKALHGEALMHEARARKFEGLERLQARKARVADLFYRVLMLEKKVGEKQAQAAVVQNMVEILERRVQAGDAAPLEAERLGIERQRLELEARRMLNAQTAQRRHLAALLQITTPERVVGQLRVEQCRVDSGEVFAIEMLEEEQKSAQKREASASRSWVPSVELQAGWIGGFQSGEDVVNGYILGLALGLGLWENRSAALEEAKAARTRHASEAAWLSRQIDRMTRAYRDECESWVEALDELDGVVSRATTHVERVQQAYLAGEMTLVEVLDAHRMLVETRDDVIEHEYALRKTLNAWISLVNGW